MTVSCMIGDLADYNRTRRVLLSIGGRMYDIKVTERIGNDVVIMAGDPVRTEYTEADLSAAQHVG